jgi:hypothetical protein
MLAAYKDVKLGISHTRMSNWAYLFEERHTTIWDRVSNGVSLKTKDGGKLKLSLEDEKLITPKNEQAKELDCKNPITLALTGDLANILKMGVLLISGGDC